MTKTDEKVFWRGRLKRDMEHKGYKWPVIKSVLATYDKNTMTQAPDYAYVQLADFLSDDELDVAFKEAKASLTSILEDEIRKQLGGRKVTGLQKRKWNIDKLQYDTGKPDVAKNLEKVWQKQDAQKDLNHRLAQSKASVTAKARSFDIQVSL